MENGSDVIALAVGVARGPSRIEYSSSAALPKLAWVATLDSEQARLSVLHGRAVECRPSFMVEGVWDGPFEAGAFHNGAHLFGSGIGWTAAQSISCRRPRWWTGSSIVATAASCSSRTAS